MSAGVDFVHDRERPPGFGPDDGFHQGNDRDPVHNSQDIQDVFFPDPPLVISQDLVQDGFRVPEASPRFPGDELEAPGTGRDVLFLDEVPQAVDDQGGGDQGEIKPLAAGLDGFRDLMGLGGGENENDVGRGLLQGFEQGVEGGGGEHVDLVNDVDLVSVAGGPVGDMLPELADVVHPGAGGPVDLDHVHRARGGDLPAGGALAAGGGGRALFAVQGLGHDSGQGGFPDAPGPGEDIGMVDPPGLDRVGQGAGDVVLAHQFLEGLGAPAAGEG